MRRLARRAAGIALVLAGAGGVIVVDRRETGPSEGAAAASGVLGAFPQVSRGRRISSSWFCPGAAAGDGVTKAYVNLSNPGDTDMIVALTFLSADHAEKSTVTVKPRSREQIEFLDGHTVGVDVPVVEIVGPSGSVEQQLEFPGGDVTAQCVPDTSTSWYFADGFTSGGSSERIVVTNPYPDPAVVNLSFTTRDGSRRPGNLQGMIIAPLSSRSISMSEAGAHDEADLAVTLEATTGRIVASRIQHYLGAGRLGYSTTVGTPRLLGQWWFASGRTGKSIDERLAVFNPGEKPVRVRVSFFGEGITGDLATDAANPVAMPDAEVEVPPGEVVDILTRDVADLPEGDHAMVVSVADGGTAVVEHVLTQETGSSSFTAVSNGLADGLLSPVWRLPSGLVGGALNAVMIVNATATEATYAVSAFGPGGKVPISGLEEVTLGPAAVSTFDVPPDVPAGEVIIEATVPVAVHRRMARNHGLVGFTVVGGLPVVGPR